ncbi:MAG TPA: TonB-dependent receptor, partial [Novosphingobium sp.]|nr:TonB-dependent receptor [Novosphingobium sp.]
YTEYNQQPQFAQLYHLNANGDPRDIFTNPAASGYAGGYFPLAGYLNTQRQSVAALDAPEYERSRTYGHALTVALDLGAATLKSTTATRSMHWTDSLDLDGSPLPVALTVRDTYFRSFSQELQLTGKALDARLSYVAGLFYYYEKAFTYNPQTYFAGSAVFDSNYGSHTRALAAYTQADHAFTERLKLTLGARFTHEQKDITRFYEVVNDPSIGITSPTVLANIPYGAVPDAKYDSFTPAATLAFRPLRDINLYARYAKGFKSGGFNGETSTFTTPTAQCPSGAPELCNPYKPETVDSFEIGAKTKWLGGKVIFNVAGFWDEHKNIQLSVFTAQGAAASAVLNAAKARIRGLEFETVLRPTSALTISGSLAYLDAHYESFIDGGVDVSNNRAFPHAPHYTASLNADARLARGHWGELHLMGDLSYVSSYFTYPYALATSSPSDQSAYTSEAPA